VPAPLLVCNDDDDDGCLVDAAVDMHARHGSVLFAVNEVNSGSLAM
jgi:hypothetical protein